jgi:hypothetical protein
MGAEHDQRVPLLPHYAFVVQWESDTQIDVGRIHGRGEHVMSRYAMRFTSLDELLAFMARVLREVAARARRGGGIEARRTSCGCVAKVGLPLAALPRQPVTLRRSLIFGKHRQVAVACLLDTPLRMG